jgi:hypothetical protein
MGGVTAVSVAIGGGVGGVVAEGVWANAGGGDAARTPKTAGGSSRRSTGILIAVSGEMQAPLAPFQPPIHVRPAIPSLLPSGAFRFTEASIRRPTSPATMRESREGCPRYLSTAPLAMPNLNRIAGGPIGKNLANATAVQNLNELEPEPIG